MRKVALLAAVIVAAAFSSMSNMAVAQGQDLNPKTTKFLQDAVYPYAATATPATPAGKAAKKKKGKKKSLISASCSRAYFAHSQTDGIDVRCFGIGRRFYC